MKIAFLCGGLEPGKSGVGDYTRCLAQECVRLGHEAVMVALSDRAVKLPAATQTTDSDICLPELRLPSGLSWEEKTAASAFCAMCRI